MNRPTPLVRCLAVALASVFGGCAPHAPTANTSATERRVYEPVAIAVLSQEGASNGLPPEVWLGGPLGRSALFLKFASEWRAGSGPPRAFLALSKPTTTRPDPARITLEAWRIDSAWQPADLHRWSDKPDLALPYQEVTVSASSAETVRIEVSELVRFFALHPERDFGIAVWARGTSERGVGLSTGMSGGAAPRLEVYER